MCLLAAATKTCNRHTTDSDVFYTKVNKVTTIGMLKRKKYRVLCDSQGHVYGRWIDDPIKTLE